MNRADDPLVPPGVANAAMVWGLLATTIPYLTFLGVEISRTRELFTVYLLTGLGMVGKWWRQTDRRTSFLITIFGGCAVSGLLTWTVAFNWEQGINYWSEWLLAAAFLVFGVGFVRQCRSSWMKIIIGYAVVLAIVQALSLVVSTSSSVLPVGGPAFYGYRPLSASVAMLLVLGFVLATFPEDPHNRSGWLLSSLLGISVVLSQNRSAWLALLVVLIGCTLALRRRAGIAIRWQGIAVTAGFFAAALAVPLATRFTLLPGASGSVDRGLPESATSVITSEWRVDMWRSRLEAGRSPLEWLTGGVLGPTPVKGPGSQVMNPLISGHNVAVDLLTMLGVTGVVMFVVLLLWACLRSGDRLAALPVFLWGLLAFGMFYNWPAWGWGVLGAALASGAVPGTGPSTNASSEGSVRAA